MLSFFQCVTMETYWTLTVIRLALLSGKNSLHQIDNLVSISISSQITPEPVCIYLKRATRIATNGRDTTGNIDEQRFYIIRFPHQ